jgi:hypothetical protein
MRIAPAVRYVDRSCLSPRALHACITTLTVAAERDFLVERQTVCTRQHLNLILWQGTALEVHCPATIREARIVGDEIVRAFRTITPIVLLHCLVSHGQ